MKREELDDGHGAGAVLIQIPPVWEEHFRLHPVLRRLLPLLLGDGDEAFGQTRGLRLPALLSSQPFTEPPPLLVAPLPGLPALLLPRRLETLQEEVAGVLVQLHIPAVELADSVLRLRGHLHAGRTRTIQLCEGRDELKAEGLLKEVLGLPLVLGQAKEGHAPKVALGALQKHGPALLLAHDRDVVAAHQAEVGQHAGLAVTSQVEGAVHELLQRATRPVIPRVAARQLRQRRRASVAHV
ncbi:unnamed protein product [Menidia menidia]|uniref:(Atlantic silverside) hypothetical protein n=1 Tax=Menidia menidia TaxID=238744 RepID=A0A8S4BLB4_9TELE|nr:unnamed protein product [Menidia menidia]